MPPRLLRNPVKAKYFNTPDHVLAGGMEGFFE
jgi:hypothetical protein